MAARDEALNGCEALIKAHQPNADGNCAACPETVTYPCDVLVRAEDIADLLRRRMSAQPKHLEESHGSRE
jgi:hypothetical protein